MISELLAGPFEVPDHKVIALAARFFREVHDDWDDCLLAAFAIEEDDGSVISFDRGLDRIPGIRRIEPVHHARE